jgi:stage II sporulation protein M
MYMNVLTELRSVFRRNRLLISVVALAFFIVTFVSALIVYMFLLTSPELVTDFQTTIGTARQLVAIPPPYTPDLYRLILLNNVGHFWNPTRVWVWIPLIGAFSLGYELLLNAIVIGGIASFTSMTRGVAYTVAGLTPHGIIEIPAFILEFAGLARWHVASTKALYTKLDGRPVDRPLLVQGIKDTLILSLISVLLFASAAYIESYITPKFLGL